MRLGRREQGFECGRDGELRISETLKSPGVAVVLVTVLGPVGLFYASPAGAVILSLGALLVALKVMGLAGASMFLLWPLVIPLGWLILFVLTLLIVYLMIGAEKVELVIDPLMLTVLISIAILVSGLFLLLFYLCGVEGLWPFLIWPACVVWAARGVRKHNRKIAGPLADFMGRIF
jgi:hypothetical protein